MASLSDISSSKFIKVLVYGDSGAGKTCLAGSFPGPIHICDFDGKVNSLAAFLKGTEKLKTISYDSYIPIDKSGGAARKFNDDMGKLALIKPFPYTTLVIDSLTTFSDEGMSYLMKESPGIKRMNSGAIQVPCQQDYQIARMWFKQVIKAILGFPCNIIFTAHINVEKDEQTGVILRAPMLAGKLKQELPIYFEEVYRMYVEQGKYLLQTKADRSFSIIRSQRSPPLKDVIPASYEEITR